MVEPQLTDPDALKIAAFLREIGIGLRLEPLAADTFLDGVAIIGGGLVADPDRLAWPGDLLHEAGHIAVTAPELRASLDQVVDDPGDEMAAIAWSWAAAQAIGIAPSVLFHEGGYRGGSDALISNFTAGRYVGVPMLQYYGMAACAGPGQARGPLDYPHMARWLR